MTFKPHDSVISRLLKTFFTEQAEFGAILHQGKCPLRYPNFPHKSIFRKRLELFEMHPPFQEDVMQCHFSCGQSAYGKATFWNYLSERCPHCWNESSFPHKTLILYTLCLEFYIPQISQKRMFETEPPAKRQRLPTSRKCGYCRVVGHSVRQCESPGIELHRARMKVDREKKKNPSPTPVSLHNNLNRPYVLPPRPPPRPHPVSPRPRASRRKEKLPPPKYPEIPKGQSRFTIESLTYLMPLTMVQRLKAGGKLTDLDIHSVWAKIPKKREITPVVSQLNLGAGDLQITRVNSVYPNCPLGLEPLRWPVVGDNCTHRETKFFNLSSLIEFWTDCGRAKQHVFDWNKCKICKQEFRPALLQRNLGYEEMLAEMKRTEVSAYKPNVVVVD